MKRSLSLPATALLVGLGAAAVWAARLALPGGGRGTPVVLVTVDTLRADRLGAYGHEGGLTPALDLLAAEGAAFEDAAATCPLTLPSHASILTGLIPARHGLRDNNVPHSLPPAEKRGFRTAAEILRGAGYATAAFVSAAPLSPRWGLDAGFDVYDAPPEGKAGEMALEERDGALTMDRALEWIRRRDRGKPFFLWVHLFDPHHPYRAPGGAGHAPDSKEAYDEEVAYADRQVGKLLEALQEEGVLDRAVVAACADHGEGLGEHGEATHGYFLYRSTIRVPLVIRHPPRVAAGHRVKAPVSVVDVLPTLLDLARVPPPRLVDGRALLSSSAAAPVPSPAAAGQYAETLYGWYAFRWAQAASIREGPIRVLDSGGGRREVYDLAADPGETTPLPPERGAAAAEAAWDLFRSRLLAEAAPGPAPEVAGLPYVGSQGKVEVLPDADNARLPLPSASFVRRFDAALRLLELARAEGGGNEAQEALDQALEALQGMGREDSRNPAIPFWEGRAYRQRAKILGPGSVQPWREAFLRFQAAGRLGYRDPRTVMGMMEAAEHAGAHREMLQVFRMAVEDLSMDGDYAFWTWGALAWYRGGRDEAGRLTPEARAAMDRCLERAEQRCRTERDRDHVREVRSLPR